jgi:gamma-glutamylcyclotransferase (GGCT)/AIG2-like uncharacterized protein YtfP
MNTPNKNNESAATTALNRWSVYGTLLAGESNHPYLEHARLVAEAKTDPAFRLYDLGPYPRLVVVGSHAVVGEVYEVDEPTLAMLDRLEGNPRFYVRKTIILESGAAVQTWDEGR